VIYRIVADSNNYRNLTFVREEDVDSLPNPQDPTPIQQSWSGVDVRYFNEEGNESLPIGGVANFAWPALTADATAALKPTIAPFGEFLMLKHNEGVEYSAFHVTHVLPAFDIDSAVVTKTPRGIVTSVKQFAFNLEDIPGKDPVMFRSPPAPLYYIFVNEPMKAAIDGTGVIGWKFTEVA